MRFRSSNAESPSIELTPLIDVVFLLLIFLMISTTFVSRTGLQIQVPEADSSAANPETARLEIMVTEKGNYLVDGEEVPKGTKLAPALRRRAENIESADETLLVIRADRNARHGAVVAAMDAGSAAGLSRVAISTVRPEAGEAK